MILESVLAVTLGWMMGILVNALADALPYRRRPHRPRYADGSLRPYIAWSGIVAFLTRQRAPQLAHPAPAYTRLGAHAAIEPRLSWRYPLAELTCITLCLLAVATFNQIPDMNHTQLWLHWVYLSILVLIVVIDIEHKLILFVVTIPTMLIALADAFLLPLPRPNLSDALAGAGLGFGIFFALYLGGFLFTYVMGQLRGREINAVAFGYGDVMLITLSGLLLGFAHTVIALFITVFLGAIGAALYLVARAVLRRYSAFTAIPYGPYIAIATVIMLLYGEQVRIAMIGY